MIGQRLASLDPETGNRPTSRIGNAGNARSLVNRLKYEDETRMYRYTRIMGLLDGNPPWPGQKLRDLGQGHRANFNLREGEGMVDAAKSPYYDLVFEVPTFTNINLYIPGADPTVVSEWEKAMAEEFHYLFTDWMGFDQQMQLHQWQMVVHGVGPMFWPHSLSWQSEATKVRKVLVPQETKANVDDLELVVVLHSWRADELDTYISGSDDNNPDYNGWNVPLVKKAIIDCAFREMRQEWGIENYDLYQRAIRTGDLFYGIHRSDRVYVASLFIREFGGRVSQYIITDSALGSGTETYSDSIENEEGYLYRKKEKFNSFREVICPFFFDTGPDGTWHAVKGLGPKIYDFCDVSNRTFCQMLDGAVIGSGITLEAQDANSLEETQLALVGGATVVSPGYKVVQTRISENLNGAMTIRKELVNTLRENTGTYRQPDDVRPEPTLGQEQIKQQISSQLTRSSINRYYNSLNGYYSETLRRALDPASRVEKVPGGKLSKMFYQHCLERGIPEEVLDFKYVRRVTATPSIGFGSPQMRDSATRELVGMVPMMSEVGRNHALRARAAALPGIGQGQVDSFFPRIENSGVPNAHTSYATTENNALRTLGGRALVEPTQNHSIHFDTHMADWMAHQKEPGAHPAELLIHGEQAGAHMHQHLERLKGDPTRKGEVKAKQKALDDMAKEVDRLDQNVREFSQAQLKAMPNPQEQQGPAPEVQAKMAKIQGDLGLKAQSQRGKHVLKAQDQVFRQRLKDKETAAKIARENAVAVAEQRRKLALSP